MMHQEIWEIHEYDYAPFEDGWDSSQLHFQCVTNTPEDARLCLQLELGYTIDDEQIWSDDEIMLHVHRTLFGVIYRKNILLVKSSIWTPKLPVADWIAGGCQTGEGEGWHTSTDIKYSALRCCASVSGYSTRGCCMAGLWCRLSRGRLSGCW